MTDHKVLGREEWNAARDELVGREKEHTRAADELARRRRDLPWVSIEKDYRFDAEDGTRTLAELFDGCSQLLVYHFMFGPTAPLERLQAYKERMGWSIPWASSANTDFSFDLGASQHVEQVREQMPPEGELPPIARHNANASGTDLPEYISELPATSVFALEDGAVYQTYGTIFRGVEFLMPYYP